MTQTQTEIVKVQIALFGGTPGHGLIYARDRRHVQVDVALPEWALLALGGAPKGYFIATLRDGAWALQQRVAEQDW